MEDSLKGFYYQQDGTQVRYLCVEFYHPSFGYIRLAQDQIDPISRNIDGVLYEFTASSCKIPEDLLFNSDDTDKGTISFNYIGYEIRKKLLAIVDMTPIQARVLQYIGETNLNPIYDKKLSVGDISLNENTCSISLTQGNAQKQVKVDRRFTADKFVGLSDQ